jgi:diaminopimelate decarboxylase
MNHFDYRDGELWAEDVPLARIAAEVGTPTYVYSSTTLERHYAAMAAGFPANTLVAYSVKANGNLAVIRTLAKLGAGADIVSEGEMRRALKAGVPPNKIVFSGVGKTAQELSAALEAGVHQFNVESEPELRALSEIAAAKGKRAPVALRINPDVDAKTHAKITTGTSANKFGVPWEQAEAMYALAASLPGIDPCGVDIHIGSQITDLAPLEAACAKAVELVRRLRTQGLKITRLDVGGGLGVPYVADQDPPPLPAAYAQMINRQTSGLDVELILEPGRLIAANAGILLAKVLYVKQGADRSFLILDAGMNDLIRPALYDAWHDILPVKPERELVRYDVVGPVCESADIFASNRELPALAQGELVAFMTAGAYGAVQGSTYNARPLAAEVLVKGAQYAIVRPRLNYEEIMAGERIAPWL